MSTVVEYEEFVHSPDNPACIKWGCWCLAYDTATCDCDETDEADCECYPEEPVVWGNCGNTDIHKSHFFDAWLSGETIYCDGGHGK